MLEWMAGERASVVSKIHKEIERYCSPDNDETRVSYTPEQMQAAKDKVEADSRFVVESFAR